MLRLTAATFLQLKQQQDQKENLLRSVGLFETFSDDQIATLAEVMQLREFKDKAPVIVQGDEGYEMFILDAGEAVVTIRNGKDEQEVKRYQAGELFGEMALLNRSLRAATVTAVGEGVRVWALGRDAFEVRLGSLASCAPSSTSPTLARSSPTFTPTETRQALQGRSRSEAAGWPAGWAAGSAAPRRRMPRRGLPCTGRAAAIRSPRWSGGWARGKG